MDVGDLVLVMATLPPSCQHGGNSKPLICKRFSLFAILATYFKKVIRNRFIKSLSTSVASMATPFMGCLENWVAYSLGRCACSGNG